MLILIVLAFLPVIAIVYGIGVALGWASFVAYLVEQFMEGWNEA